MYRALRRFGLDCRSVAALEFALAAPVMSLMLAAPIEITNAIRIQTKLNVAAGQLADMIAGQISVTEGSAEGPGGTLGDMCNAVAYNLLPYNPAYVSAWIQSAIVVQGWNGPQLFDQWVNDKSCPTVYAVGSFNETLTLGHIADNPRSLFTQDGTPSSAGGSFVTGYSAVSLQLFYMYPNVLPFFLGRTIFFTAVASARSRSNAGVTCTYPSGSGTAACPGVY